MANTTFGFDQAKAYAENSEPQLNLVLRVLDRIDIPVNSDILDIGCGDGKITAAFTTKTSGRIVGLDISPEMIDFANNKYSDLTQTNKLQFIVENAANIQSRDDFESCFYNRFDLITAFFCLHWISYKDQLKFLLAVKSSLRTNGQFVASLSLDVPQLYSAVNKTKKQNAWKNYFEDFTDPRVFYTPEKFKEIANEAGLLLTCSNVEEHTHTFDSLREFKEHYRPVSPAMKHLPEDKRENFLNDLVANLCEKLNIPLQKNDSFQQKVTLAGSVLYVVSRK